MKKLSLIFIVLLLISCEVAETEPNENSKEMAEDKVFVENVSATSGETMLADADGLSQTNYSETHLKDTIEIKGNAIIILLPDSLRFQSFIDKDEEWIYEVDSDFGFGISEAMDSLKPDFAAEFVTKKRFISIADCLNCPAIIDRDTINYGVILTSKGKPFKISEDIFGSAFYMDLITEYYKK